MDQIDIVKRVEEFFWINSAYKPTLDLKSLTYTLDHVLEADARLNRFRTYLKNAFPETAPMDGLIESPLAVINHMRDSIYPSAAAGFDMRLFLKCDSHLPIAGSVKARGGIYTVLKHAESIAIEEGLLKDGDSYELFDSAEFRQFFSEKKIAVGSTGNLGLSIGIMSARLGFKVTVHMSADAKQWKKDLLRSKGVEVIEYESDYSKAVEEGRKLSAQDENSFFVDDENSVDLFLGYSVAALRLKKQLDEFGIEISKESPLFLYLPCGVGGAPGGIAYGAKLLWGENVHCFFAEPTHSPCMLVGMMTGLHDKISVQDLGIDNITAADGLAVGRPSGFIGHIMEPLLSGIYTIDDSRLFDLLKKLADTENLWLEPSALAGIFGPSQLLFTSEGAEYIRVHDLENSIKKGTHLAWATGGSLVPKEIMEEYYLKG